MAFDRAELDQQGSDMPSVWADVRPLTAEAAKAPLWLTQSVPLVQVLTASGVLSLE